jgi:hypothetical protein
MFTALALSDFRVGVANTIAYCNELMAGPRPIKLKKLGCTITSKFACTFVMAVTYNHKIFTALASSDFCEGNDIIPSSKCCLGQRSLRQTSIVGSDL